ncbi:MAG TPA: UvrD-helicase domain-containing protein [Candidatus Dormibacteraeota bacterium]|nr:UvrD-helicase domain-containing protein [Candidatus Dormibacteraeota bacterium]
MIQDGPTTGLAGVDRHPTDQDSWGPRLAAILNPPQLEAVTAPDGPLLVFAGAGSGKTRVLTYRIAHLIESGRAQPDGILAVTFTNKAAREMRQRIESLLGAGQAEGPAGSPGTPGRGERPASWGGSPAWMGTFHNICGRVLRRDGHLIGVDRSYVIYDEGDRLSAVKRAMAGLGLDEKRFPPNAVVGRISTAKNEIQGPTEYAAAASDYFSEVVARVYPVYEGFLRDASGLDFDDLLLKVVRLWQEDERSLERWRHRFRHVLVDEYQDTNRVQYTLVKLLAEEHRNLCVVGDDDQSIYRFRGADVRNILSFERDFPEARVIKLEQNYRSTQSILDAAHAVIKAVADRADKRLWTDRGAGEKVFVAQVYDEQEEAEAIAAEVRRLVARDGSLNDIAVLYRTNAQSRALEEVMVRQGIPYKLVGGVRFYERREVKDALAYLRVMFNPNDTVAFNRVVNVPRRKVGDKTVQVLEAAARQRGISVWDLLAAEARPAGITASAAEGLQEFRALVEGLRRELDRHPLPEVIEMTLARTGLQAWVSDGSEEGAERWQNLLELKGLAAEYSGLRGMEALGRFLEDAALVSDVDSLDEAKPGLTLITLHMVKGLEFPVVFMAGMEEGLLPHIRAIEEPGGIDEERRLCYVGMTRAMRRLYLFHAFRRHLFGNANLNLPSRFLNDLPEEIVERPAGSSRSTGANRASVLDAVSRQPAAPAPPPVQRYREGQRVSHRAFGPGVVVKSTLTRSDEELIVRFDNVGIKILSASLAPLETA